MKEFKTYLILIILTAVLSGQVVWNEPPDTIWYGNQSRWVEIQKLHKPVLDTNFLSR